MQLVEATTSDRDYLSGRRVEVVTKLRSSTHPWDKLHDDGSVEQVARTRVPKARYIQAQHVAEGRVLGTGGKNPPSRVQPGA